jgi:GNAT superfamily N-acetyltransferase
VIRRATYDDIESGVRVLTATEPQIVLSVESYRHSWDVTPAEAHRAWWCAQTDDTVVGWASCGLMVETSEPGVGWLGVAVDPGHRSSGYGTALLDAAELHACEIGVARLVVWSRGDDATTSFARGRGYVQTGSAEWLVVDPRTIETPIPPKDVELRAFTELADDPSRIYDVDVAAMLDEPGDTHFDAVEYDYWLDRFWRQPLLDHDASMAVLVDGTVVSITRLHTDRASGRALNNGTATLREHRGRGLAMLAKQASLVRAAELGCTAAYTATTPRTDRCSRSTASSATGRARRRSAGRRHSRPLDAPQPAENGNERPASAGDTCAVTQTGVVA